VAALAAENHVVPPALAPSDVRHLFDTARAAIRARLGGVDAPAVSGDAPAALRAERGCFVTLEVDGELRGCIGHATARRPLVEAVAHLAVASATGDRRFAPIREDEVERMHVELSVLTPLVKIDPLEVQVGVHGLQVRLGERVGLLLPQVASERGWDRETFLAQTCRKAGLPQDAWRRAELLAFEAEVHVDAPGAAER
jgi:AmmeMemoRadiSam system protein A